MPMSSQLQRALCRILDTAVRKLRTTAGLVSVVHEDLRSQQVESANGAKTSTITTDVVMESSHCAGKSPHNAGAPSADPNDRKCGSCAGQLFSGGGRRPSPRSYTRSSVESCAGQLERAKDIVFVLTETSFVFVHDVMLRMSS